MINLKTKKVITIYIIIILAFVLAFSFCSCADSRASYKKYSYEFFGTFDTIVIVAGYAQSQKEFDEYSSYAYDRFNELHKLFDNYKTYVNINNIKTINDSTGIAPVEVDSVIIDLLSFCINSNKNILSKTDISMGALLKVWHQYRETGLNEPENAKLPSPKELQAANSFTGIDNIIIDEKKNTVLLKEGTALDLGAVAKGYATQLIAQELFEMGFKSFYISSGGNVKAVGAPIDETRSFWGIGLQNPFYFTDPDNNENLIDIAYIENLSVVTSGDYQRFYEVEGTRYHHLIDPETLYPAGYFSAVTIFTEDSGLADFLSTAVFMMPYEEGLVFIESLEGIDAYWIFKDGTIKATDGAKKRLKVLGGATN